MGFPHAKEDDVSLNQWIVEAISQRCGTYSVRSSKAGVRCGWCGYIAASFYRDSLV